VSEQAVGDVLDNLGVRVELDDTDLVSSAVVVMSVMVEGDDNPRLMIASSEGLGWIQQAGLLRLAERICSEPPRPEDE
jgi:hypothetical protein